MAEIDFDSFKNFLAPVGDFVTNIFKSLIEFIATLGLGLSDTSMKILAIVVMILSLIGIIKFLHTSQKALKPILIILIILLILSIAFSF
ncbi:MAG: hypothetical protein AABY22_23430 [Nanoarchaeota archaeon]